MLPLTFRGTEYYHAIAFKLPSGRSGSHSHMRTPSSHFPMILTVVKRGIGSAALHYDHMAPVCPRVNSNSRCESTKGNKLDCIAPTGQQLDLIGYTKLRPN
jgi:hypothetical protein